MSFDLLMSSDLQRSLATARIVAEEATTQPGEGAQEVKADPRLREIDCGLWDGLTLEEAKARYPEDYARRELDLVNWRFTGGESFQDLRDRVLPVLWETADSGAEKALMVGHLGVNRVILCELQGLPLKELFSLKMEYCSVVVLRFTGPSGAGRRVEVLTASSGSRLPAVPGL